MRSGSVITIISVTISLITMIACSSPESPTPAPPPPSTPAPEFEIDSPSQFWALVMRSDDEVVGGFRDSICEDPGSVDLDDLMDSVQARYEGRIGLGEILLTRMALHVARRDYCDGPLPTAAALPWVSDLSKREFVAYPTPTATSAPKPSPTPFVLRKGYTGGGGRKAYEETPQPFRLTPTPTPTPQPTATPYPTPVSKVYFEPEFVTSAVRVVASESEQEEFYGRELWDDEWASLVWGVSNWTTVNFQRRCLTREGEYLPATELIKERYPNAEFYRDASETHYDSRAESREYHFNIYPQFDRRLREFRYVRNVYNAVLDDGKRQWLLTISAVRFNDCQAVRIEPSRIRDNDGYITVTRWFTTRQPLIESEVERGRPDSIGCRSRSCREDGE